MALAGIMGGANSGMDENTTSLLFECATFARDCVRKTSRAWARTAIPLPAMKRVWTATLPSWAWPVPCT